MLWSVKSRWINFVILLVRCTFHIRLPTMSSILAVARDLILGEEHFLQHLGWWWVHLDGASEGSGGTAGNRKGSAEKEEE
ncbi:hypothetical protein AAZX31_03G091400 [Glycine max]